MKLDVTMTPDQVKLACVEFLARKNMKVIGDVDIVIKSGTHYVGYGQAERVEPYAMFTGATANVEIQTVDANLFDPGNL